MLFVVTTQSAAASGSRPQRFRSHPGRRSPSRTAASWCSFYRLPGTQGYFDPDQSGLSRYE